MITRKSRDEIHICDFNNIYDKQLLIIYILYYSSARRYMTLQVPLHPLNRNSITSNLFCSIFFLSLISLSTSISSYITII